jgi:hypothetical protein
MFRSDLTVSGPFVCRCLTSHALLRFHPPPVEPDVRISRIRLSDFCSPLRPQQAVRSPQQLDQSQLLVQVLIGISCISHSRHAVLATQPLTHPFPHVLVYDPIRFLHRTQAEVVRPSAQSRVQARH